MTSYTTQPITANCTVVADFSDVVFENGFEPNSLFVPNLNFSASQPGGPGSSVQFSVTVIGNSTLGAPTGMMDFSNNISAVLATCTIFANSISTGSCSTSAFANTGSTTFTATYVGDANYSTASAMATLIVQ